MVRRRHRLDGDRTRLCGTTGRRERRRADPAARRRERQQPHRRVRSRCLRVGPRWCRSRARPARSDRGSGRRALARHRGPRRHPRVRRDERALEEAREVRGRAPAAAGFFPAHHPSRRNTQQGEQRETKSEALARGASGARSRHRPGCIQPGCCRSLEPPRSTPDQSRTRSPTTPTPTRTWRLSSRTR